MLSDLLVYQLKSYLSKSKLNFIVFILFGLSTILSGCAHKQFSPSLGKYKKEPSTNGKVGFTIFKIRF